MDKEVVVHISSVQSLSRVQFFATPWTAAHQASLSITNSWSLLKLMSIESVMPSNHLILHRPFSSCLQSFPAWGFFPISQLFVSGVYEPRVYCTDCSKSEREGQTTYINAYIWNLERWYWWSYMQGSKGDTDVKKDFWTQWEKEMVGWFERIALKHIYYHM